RHPKVFRLSARDLTIELRVSEESGAAAVLAHLSRLALGLQASAAHEAVSTGDVERNHDPIADLELRHVGADLDDLSHRLMPEHVTAIEERTEQFVEVQVGSADRR